MIDETTAVERKRRDTQDGDLTGGYSGRRDAI